MKFLKGVKGSKVVACADMLMFLGGSLIVISGIGVWYDKTPVSPFDYALASCCFGFVAIRSAVKSMKKRHKKEDE